MNLRIKLLCLCSLFLFGSGHTESADIVKTKSQIKELDNKITRLERTLSTSIDKKAILDQELAMIEKHISISIKELHTIHTHLGENQEKIKLLNKKLAHLNHELTKEQRRMAEHIRTRYKMGEYQPLKWLLNQENPYAISQLLTYYQYLIQAQKQSIAKVKTIKHSLTQNQCELNQQLIEQEDLEKSLAKEQSQLKQDKNYQTKLIERLEKDINHKKNILAEYQNNKTNLGNLLIKLSQQSVLRAQKPFFNMRKKLPLPVQVNKSDIDKINQGIMFFANEGLPVGAVYAGKVVFSDWLKGYGLLIIIDHGRGFMTLYAHNQSLFKQKGESVDQGEQIATVGHSGGLKQNGLYFEIRHRGKAISPLDWLS